MKNKGFSGAFGLLLLPVSAFLGCYTGAGGDDRVYQDMDDNNAIKVVSIRPKDLKEPEYGEAEGVSGGANDFAFRLSAALAEQQGSKNLVCSPLSVWIPLAALVNGVREDYKDDLVKALGVPGLAAADINTGVSGMLYDLTRQREKAYYGEGDYPNPLILANAIFVDYDAALKQNFVQAFMDYFRGSSIQVDFASPEAVGEVNNWVKKYTDGMIPEIVQGFPPGTEAVIANAVHFFDRWSGEFDPDETEEDVFHAPGGESTAFYMLREGDDLPYYEDDRVQALPLRFSSGGAMYILLPRDGNAAGLLEGLSSAYFREIQAGLEPARGKLRLPRFSIEGEVMSFKEILLGLDIPLFETGSLLGVLDTPLPVQLSDALHKAVIRVDEKGTTAAAVTLLLIGASSAGPQEPPEKTFEMNCNKPFVFVLCDRGEQVVFTGMVNTP